MSIVKLIIAPVSMEDISTGLNISLTPEGNIARPIFVKGSLREILMRRNFDVHTPAHFFNKYLKDNIRSLNKASGKKAGNRGGNDKKHSFFVHWSGLCYANIDGCNYFCNTGITQDNLTQLAKGECDLVRITMPIHGNCKYIWKKSMGLSGIYLGSDKLAPLLTGPIRLSDHLEMRR